MIINRKKTKHLTHLLKLSIKISQYFFNNELIVNLSIMRKLFLRKFKEYFFACQRINGKQRITKYLSPFYADLLY